MTEQLHPIVPPLELVRQWLSEFYDSPTAPGESTIHIATRAAQWGAEQELEACCSFLEKEYPFQFEAKWECTRASDDLRAARRPRLQTLKQQALQELDKVDMLWATKEFGKETLNSLDTIRKALEALPDD